MKVADMLLGGDLRSKGRSEDIVKSGLADKSVFLDTLDCLFLPDLLIQTRAADAIEKITREKPQWLTDVKKKVLSRLQQFEGTRILQMHIAMLIGRMSFTDGQQERILPLLEDGAFNDHYTFTKVAAMQGYCDQAAQHTTFLPPAKRLLVKWMEGRSPAIISRGKRLLKEVED